MNSIIPTTTPATIPTTLQTTTTQPRPTPATTTQPNTTPPPYSYLQFIKTPSEMGMSDKGSMETIETNINGLIGYVDLLVDGKSKASKAQNNGPLGNSFFVTTTAKCDLVDKMTGIKMSVPRSIYVNNIPTGGIGAAPGANVPEFRGLIPGMMSGMSALDPARMAESLSNASSPECISVTLNVTDDKGAIVPSTNYITISDAKYVDPCSFTDFANPVTNGVCAGKKPPPPPTVAGTTVTGTPVKQGFTTRTDLLFSEISNDYVAQIFLSSVGILGIFILHLLLKNRFK